METHKYVHILLRSLHGSIAHYFHFMYGVLLPIILEYIEYSKKYKNLTFIIDQDVGPMLKILLQLPIDIKLKEFIKDFDKLDVEVIKTKPMDPYPTGVNEIDRKMIEEKRAKNLTKDDYFKINNFMKSCILNYDLLLCNKKYDIVIIERKKTIGYKTTNFAENMYTSIMKTSGEERRSIKNHEKFVKNIRNIFVDSDIINISLENLPLFDQYFLFNNAKIVIAQHGAALGNIVFMKQNSIVIEIISKQKLYKGEDWFMPISKTCDIKHYQFITDDEHVSIDNSKFKKFIQNILE